MRCYECGYQNDAEARVCVKCGTKLEAGSAAPQSPTPKVDTPASPAPSSGAKTMRGQAASAPSWDSPKQAPPAQHHATSSTIIKCPSCHYYPLSINPSAANPCPNCGFGAAEQGASSKTVKIDSIQVAAADGSTPSFSLIDENSGKQISFSGNEIAINRDAIDPNNNSISSQIHAMFSFEGGKLHLEDKSSNGATFIKVEGKMPLANGNKIVIGNKVFKVKID